MAGVYGNMMAIPRNGRGGALPEYQGDGRVYTPGAGVSARLSDSAAGIYRQTAAQTGQGLRDLARGIDTANRIGMAAYEDYNKTKATQLMVEYRTRVNDAMYGDNGLMTRKGEDAFQADRELERRSQQIREEVLKDYRGSLAENLFNMRLQTCSPLKPRRTMDLRKRTAAAPLRPRGMSGKCWSARGIRLKPLHRP